MSLKDFITDRIKDITLGVWFPSEYRRVAKQPVVQSKVLFIEGKTGEMPDSFSQLWTYFESDDRFEPEFISLNRIHTSLPGYYWNCRTLVRKLATAKYAFLEDANDVVSCVPLRPETQITQLWHACGAFKKWGMSCADLKFGNNAQQLRKHPFYRNLSLVTTSSPDVNWAYEEAMDLQGQNIVKALGVSRTDVYFDDRFLETSRSSIESQIPSARDKKILLYAPTFRGTTSNAQGPDKLDIEAMRTALENDYVLLIKHHPFVKDRPPIPESCSNFAFDVSEMLPIDQLLCCADICITDYSSIVFEYSLFERPILFFAYDLDDYNDWRGFYYPYEEMTPGPVVRTTSELLHYLAELKQDFDAEDIRKFKTRFMSSCDGKATKRVLEELGITAH